MMSTWECIVPDSPLLGRFEIFHNKTEKKILKPAIYNKMIGGKAQGDEGSLQVEGGLGETQDQSDHLTGRRWERGENYLLKK